MAFGKYQYQGKAIVRVNGQEYPTLTGATFTPSGEKREEVTGARVYGYKSTPRAATLEFAADSGETHMMTNAWSNGEESLTDAGEISAKFTAIRSQRVA
ncbi:phage tail tube protein [Arsenophonus sp. PmNCSU2021_1]|uniref:phage tail tube protein n=1 Tax=Arsenophonus sp. PmNCSU2021_1 TaxID=3118989 RepID=UPI002FF16474